MGNIRVSIIIPCPQQRDKYALLIGSSFGYSVVSKYACSEEATRHLLTDKPDVVLVGVDAQSSASSQIAFLSGSRSKSSDFRILVLSNSDDEAQVIKALQAGVQGYLLHNEPPLKLLQAIKEVQGGGAPLSSPVARKIVASFHKNPHSPLTPRETLVLTQLSKGKTHSEIAQDLSINKETVRTHMKNIYLKLDVKSKFNAIGKAKALKII